MYGLVNKAIEEMVRRGFGDDAWERVKARAGVDVELFISNQPYDDQITYNLVGAASELTGIPAERLLFNFGEHWILHTSRAGYGALMDAAGKTLPEFLENLPNFHTRIAMIFPHLEPPRFAVSDRTATSLKLHYHTHRSGLIPFVEGLLSGLGKKFQTPVRSTLLESKAAGAPHDVFLVEWNP